MTKLRLIIFYLALGIYSLSAQTFTNIVNEEVLKHAVFNYNYQPFIDGKITNSLYFFVKFDGGVSNFDGEISHLGEAVGLRYESSLTNVVLDGPFDKFNSEKKSGNWQLKFNTEYPILVREWGVFQSPEPSCFAIFLIGGSVALIFRRRL